MATRTAAKAAANAAARAAAGTAAATPQARVSAPSSLDGSTPPPRGAPARARFPPSPPRRRGVHPSLLAPRHDREEDRRHHRRRRHVRHHRGFLRLHAEQRHGHPRRFRHRRRGRVHHTHRPEDRQRRVWKDPPPMVRRRPPRVRPDGVHEEGEARRHHRRRGSLPGRHLRGSTGRRRGARARG